MRIHYRVSGEGIEIVRCFGTDSQVVIPEQIEGKPVIKAAPYAFSARKDKEEIDVQTYDTDQIGQRSAEEKLLAGDAAFLITSNVVANGLIYLSFLLSIQPFSTFSIRGENTELQNYLLFVSNLSSR